MKKLILIAFIIFFPLAVSSQGGQIKAYGVFDVTCGGYLKEIADNPVPKNSYAWWIAGFVTGTNLEKGRATSTDSAGHEAWILKYCQENPLDTFMKAAIELNKELDKILKSSNYPAKSKKSE